MTATLHAGGEALSVLERVVVAPSVGVFRPQPPDTVTTEGEIVQAGQLLGVIEASGDQISVTSPFEGWMMGMLAVEGERVREGQPICWLRTL